MLRLTSIREQSRKEGDSLPEVGREVARDDSVDEISLSAGLKSRQPGGELELLPVSLDGQQGRTESCVIGGYQAIKISWLTCIPRYFLLHIAGWRSETKMYFTETAKHLTAPSNLIN